ncbi:30S ribosomal protein S20 [Pajaroellobacter abortibovis]|uniref:Small ribosomal subunit protein bS20 n=1 Tax=Pajaroellobacter abortibovis TaxID=1882918 RepID=A0A1L6MVS9_9BACT|nr:30S ribosomal protein S20 [Pajaroellobacter abortibovis]APR99584.1 30S ribosomal protein S20 [Pajaroellobacter abortibovis]
MASHPSAEKRNRQRIKRTLHRRGIHSAVRTFVKRVRVALRGVDTAVAQVALKEAISKLGKAASKGIIHEKAASRTVARLSRQVSQLIRAAGNSS